MKKLAILILAIFMSAALLASCGTQGDSSDSSATGLVNNGTTSTASKESEATTTTMETVTTVTTQTTSEAASSEESGKVEGETAAAPGGTPTSLSEEEIDKQVRELSASIIKTIETKDFKTLATIVHPVKGVRVGQYTKVDFKNDLLFMNTEIGSIFTDSSTKHVWGMEPDGKTEVKLTGLEYFNRFMYEASFAEYRVSYNSPSLPEAISIKGDYQEMYSELPYADYYYAGTKEGKYLDWQGLRLVYGEYNNKLYLEYIINSSYSVAPLE